MSSPDPDTFGILKQARAQAATLGAFNPSRLLNPGKKSHLDALQKLAHDCAEVMEDGKALWLLNPDVRAQTLRDLASDELSIALNSVRPARGDRLGQLLHEVLHGTKIESGKFQMQELGVLRTALHFASSVRDTKESVREIDRLLSRRDVEQATQALLPSRLVGRNAQLTKLRDFVHGDAGVAAEQIMWITGAGGSGKSALLAKFADAMRAANVPVIQIDFDRPAMYSGSLTTLMMEVSRQMEVCFPEMEAALSNYRRKIRTAESVQTDPGGYEQVQLKEQRRTSVWQACMAGCLPIDREVVLILDTAEEVGLSSEFDIEGLRRWLRLLRTQDGLPKLRTVLSGRAFEADELALVPDDRKIELRDLAPGGAVSLLRMFLERKKVTGDIPLDDLVEMLGGNPLMLKILAEYVAEGGRDCATDLLADRQEFDRQFAQAFLYKRILGRIRTHEEDLVKLAHPGLILRRVTPHLIQHVLAGPCGLGDIGDARARELFQRLAGQVWLVQRTTNPDVVVHRRDLRRLMLQAMTAKDESTALQIHTAAANYYLEGKDPLLTPQEQQLEGMYHQLFIPGAQPPDPERLEAFARTIGEDLDSAPLPVRARIKLDLRRKLTAAEEQVLSANEQALYQSNLDRKALRTKGVATRENLFSPGSRILQLDDARVAVAELHAAFEQGALDMLAPGTTAAIQEFAGAIAQGNAKYFGEDFTQSAAWRCAIATLRHRDDPLVPALLATMTDLRNPQVWDRPVIGSPSRALSPANAYQMLFRLHGADLPQSTEPWRFGDPSSRVFLTQELRNFQLRDKRPVETPVVSTRLLRDLSEEFRKYFSGQGEQPIQLDKEAAMDLAAQYDLEGKDGPVRLNALDHLGGRNGGVLILDMENMDREAKDIFIGPLPEIYPLVRAAARACKPESLLAFAADAGKEHALWPIELSRNHLKPALASQREQWTATLITIADRFGLLRRFIDWLEDRNPRLSRRHKHLLQTVRDYELRLRQFI